MASPSVLPHRFHKKKTLKSVMLVLLPPAYITIIYLGNPQNGGCFAYRFSFSGRVCRGCTCFQNRRERDDEKKRKMVEKKDVEYMSLRVGHVNVTCFSVTDKFVSETPGHTETEITNLPL